MKKAARGARVAAARAAAAARLAAVVAAVKAVEVEAAVAAEDEVVVVAPWNASRATIRATSQSCSSRCGNSASAIQNAAPVENCIGLAS